jgi:hypothetical protein
MQSDNRSFCPVMHVFRISLRRATPPDGNVRDNLVSWDMTLCEGEKKVAGFEYSTVGFANGCQTFLQTHSYLYIIHVFLRILFFQYSIYHLLYITSPLWNPHFILQLSPFFIAWCSVSENFFTREILEFQIILRERERKLKITCV